MEYNLSYIQTFVVEKRLKQMRTPLKQNKCLFLDRQTAS